MEKLTEAQLVALCGDSIVRRNLLTRPGYTPYCGAERCIRSWPRTTFDINQGQFVCRCGWISKYVGEFIAAYREYRVDTRQCCKCGVTVAANISKYCGDGSDKDNSHDWVPAQRPRLLLPDSEGLPIPADLSLPIIESTSDAQLENEIAQNVAYAQFCYDLDKLPTLEQKQERIDDAIHRLGFERRWQSLTPAQRDHMCDESLKPAERAAIDACKTDAERNERIDMYARARYFRSCAWMSYLNGETKEPPIK